MRKIIAGVMTFRKIELLLWAWKYCLGQWDGFGLDLVESVCCKKREFLPSGKHLWRFGSLFLKATVHQAHFERSVEQTLSTQNMGS